MQVERALLVLRFLLVPPLCLARRWLGAFLAESKSGLLPTVSQRMLIALVHWPLLLLASGGLCNVQVVVVTRLTPFVPIVAWRFLTLALTTQIEVLVVLVMGLRPSSGGSSLVVLAVALVVVSVRAEGCGLERRTALAQWLVLLTVL